MEFYLVENIGPLEYDTTRSAVIYATSANVAKEMFLRALESEYHAEPVILRARKIKQDGKLRIVHTHFHAG